MIRYIRNMSTFLAYLAIHRDGELARIFLELLAKMFGAVIVTGLIHQRLGPFYAIGALFISYSLLLVESFVLAERAHDRVLLLKSNNK